MGVLIRFQSGVSEPAHIGAIVRATLQDQDIEVRDVPYSKRIFSPIGKESEAIHVFGGVEYRGGLLDILYSSGTLFSPAASAEELAGTGLTSFDGELRFAKPERVSSQIPLSSILDTAPSADAISFHADVAAKLLKSDKIDATGVRYYDTKFTKKPTYVLTSVTGRGHIADDQWSELIQQPILVVTDKGIIQRRYNRILKGQGFTNIKYGSCHGLTLLKQHLKSKYTFIILDALNGFQRDETGQWIKVNGPGASRMSTRYTKGHTSEGRIYGVLGKTIHEIEISQSNIPIFVVSNEDNWKQGVVDARGQEFLHSDKLIAVKDPGYILIREKTKRKPAVLEPRPEFLRILYDTMVAPNKG